MSDADKERLADQLAPFTRDSAGHYTYRIKGRQAVSEHMQRIGETIHEILQKLGSTYKEETAYQVMARLFEENFTLEEQRLRTKENNELSSDSLQSLDDLEASFCTKAGKHYKGYVANITETCDPENELQLVLFYEVVYNHYGVQDSLCFISSAVMCRLLNNNINLRYY